MAITPTQAKRQATPDEQTLKNLEKRIDETLVRALRSGTTPTYDTEGMDVATRTALARRYQTAGWDVRHINDQHDGNYLTFKEQQEYYDPRDNFGGYNFMDR